MALGAHMFPYSYIYYAPHRDEVLQFVFNGYCVFEDDVCVDLSSVLDGKSNYTNVPFSGLFVRPCVDRLMVRDEGPDYATTLLSEFCARARCLPVLAPFGVATVEVKSCEEGRFRPEYFRFFFFFDFLLFIFFFLSPLLFFLCFLAISLVQLLRHLCSGSI